MRWDGRARLQPAVGLSAGDAPASVAGAGHRRDASILHLSVDGVADLIDAEPAAGQQGVTMGRGVGCLPDVAWALRLGAAVRRAS